MPQVTQGYLDARREEILGAAHRCFARGGFRDTTMQQIAKEAGLSVGALYRYFDSKEVLIEDLAARGRVQKARLLAEDPPGPGGGGLVQLVSELLAALTGSAEADEVVRFDVRIWGEALGHPELQPLVERGLAAVRDPIAAHLGSETGDPSTEEAVDPDTAARLVVSLLTGLELQLAFDPSLDRKAYAAGVTRLLAGLRG